MAKDNLIIREPDLYFESLHNELNNFLRDTILAINFSNPLNIKKHSTWRPATEIKQTDKCYEIKVQLPGVKKEDIDITLDNDFMTITAKIEEEEINNDVNHEANDENNKENDKTFDETNNEKLIKYHTCEFKYGTYKRTISFEQPINLENSTAEYKDGVLKIKIEKQQIEESKTRHLEVK